MSIPTPYSWAVPSLGTGTGGGGPPGSTTSLGLPKLESRIVVPVGGWEVSLTDADGTAVPVTVPAGDYYLNSVAPGGTVSFVAAVKAALDNGAGVTYIVGVDDDIDGATGKVTIAVSSGTFSLTWTDTDLRDVLGFAGASIATTTSATGTMHARHLWLPNTGHMAEQPDPAFGEGTQDFGRAESDYASTCSPSGVTTATVFNVRRLAHFTWEPLLGLKTWLSDEQLLNESFERFWLDVMNGAHCDGGDPHRYYSDRSDDDGYWTLTWDGDGKDMRPSALVRSWVGPRSLWHLEYSTRKYVVVNNR
jgi:hypothetical protein